MSQKTKGLLGILVLILAGGWWWLSARREPQPGPVRLDPTIAAATPKASGPPVRLTSKELPAIRPSRYLNATQDAGFVGTEACRECHADEYQSYQETAHSKAMGEINLDLEPPDTAFDHAASGRSYRVYREGDQFRHREWHKGQDGSETTFVDHPVRYVIGSGNHSRSYIVEEDGFLLESPATWYASTRHWGMSPGYDRPDHFGFERSTDLGCLFCHAGRVDAQDDNRFRVNVHEHSIGCESCHGPGALHVARHRSGEPYDAGEDLTIVNPDKLSREASESVCALCHLLGEPSVWMPGRDPMGFRPGLLLSDFRLDYSLEQPDKSMTVVGHIEQMKLSRCYQESEQMTCTTCHDPHGRPAEKTKVSYFKQRCLNCHQDGCHLEESVRLEKSAEDNCIQCHMVQSKTDIPHFVFTHHRIGFHDDTEQQPSEPGIGNLQPIADVDHLPQVIKDRALGVAYFEFISKQRSPVAQQTYRQQAKTLLESVYQSGLRDAELEALLARLALEERDFPRAAQLATSSLDQPSLLSSAHAIALHVLSDSYMNTNDFAAANEALGQLVEYRRDSTDWTKLAIARQRIADNAGAIEALEQAVRLAPFRADLQQLLADWYRAVGRISDARKHREIARALQESQQARAIP